MESLLLQGMSFAPCPQTFSYWTRRWSEGQRLGGLWCGERRKRL